MSDSSTVESVANCIFASRVMRCESVCVCPRDEMPVPLIERSASRHRGRLRWWRLLRTLLLRCVSSTGLGRIHRTNEPFTHRPFSQKRRAKKAEVLAISVKDYVNGTYIGGLISTYRDHAVSSILLGKIRGYAGQLRDRPHKGRHELV